MSLFVTNARDGTAEDAREDQCEYLNPNENRAGDQNPLPLVFDEVLKLFCASGFEYDVFLLQPFNFSGPYGSRSGLAISCRWDATRTWNFEVPKTEVGANAFFQCAVVAVEAGVEPVVGTVGATALEVALNPIDQHFGGIRVADPVARLDQFLRVSLDFVSYGVLVVNGPEE